MSTRRRRTRGPVRPMLARVAALMAGVLLVSGAAALTWWGERVPAAPEPLVRALQVPAPAADTVYACPAAPANTLGAVDLRPAAATTSITLLGDARSALYGGRELDPSTPLRVDSAEGGILTVHPGSAISASATGLVTTLTEAGDLRGLTAAPCAPDGAVSWIVGGSSAVGSSAELRLTNPGATTVTATVALYGSTGPISLPSGGIVAVPAGQTVGVLLESAAADPRLALSVTSEGGTLIPALATESLDGETPAGAEVLTAGAAPGTDLTVPGVVLVDPAKQGQSADAAGAVSSDVPAVRIVNPGDQAATVSLSMLGPEGESQLAGASGVVVDPGAVFDISLAGVSPGSYGVHVTSDRAVGAAVRLVRSGGEYPARSGALVHDVGWIQAQDSQATVSGALTLPAGGMTSVLTISNSGTAAAAIAIAAVDGSWSQEVGVPAGSTVAPELPAGVSALTLRSAEGASVTAAAVVTAEVGGDVPGTLIAVVPPVSDAAVADALSLLPR